MESSWHNIAHITLVHGGGTRIFKAIFQRGGLWFGIPRPLCAIVRACTVLATVILCTDQPYGLMEGSSSLRTIVFTGSTDGCTSHSYTDIFTSPTISGSYQLHSPATHFIQ